MKEELGVLLRKDNPYNNFKYHVLVDNYVEYTDNIETVKRLGTHITRKEAEQFPQFEWVSLEELK